MGLDSNGRHTFFKARSICRRYPPPSDLDGYAIRRKYIAGGESIGSYRRISNLSMQTNASTPREEYVRRDRITDWRAPIQRIAARLVRLGP